MIEGNVIKDISRSLSKFVLLVYAVRLISILLNYCDYCNVFDYENRI